jgi:hypothetical protein
MTTPESTPDPQQPSDPPPGAAQPTEAEESATEQVSFDKPTTQMPAPQAGASHDQPTAPPYGPQDAQPYAPLPGQLYDPQTGRPLDPPAPPAYNAAYPAPYAPPPGYGPQYYGGYPPYGYGGYPPPRPTNGMAVASLVLGILWIYWVGSIMALVFGYVARQQIAQRGESGGGLAVAGIVLGWIGVGTLALVVFFLSAVDLAPQPRY